MKVVTIILNGQTVRNYEIHEIFAMLQRKSLQEICQQVNSDSDFNDKIKDITKSIIYTFLDYLNT